MKELFAASIACMIGAVLLLIGAHAGKEDQKKEISTVSSPDFINDKRLLNSMIKIESGGNAKAYNKSSGAVGLMQLTPVIYSTLCGLTKEEAFDPVRNVACGDLYMHILLKKYKNNLEKALTFYNNGHIVRNTKYATKVMKEGK